MGRASSNPKSATCPPVPNKSNGDADEEDPEDPEPPRRATRLRTKAATTTSTDSTAATAAASKTSATMASNSQTSSVEKEDEENDAKKSSKKPSTRVSKRELESINVSSENDVKAASASQRSKRVIRKPTTMSSSSVAVKGENVDIHVEEDDRHHLIDCCFIRVSGQVYRRWKEVKKRLKFVRDEDLVLYFLELQSEEVPVQP